MRTAQRLCPWLQIQYVVETRFSFFGCSSYDLISHYMSPSLMYCAFSVSALKQSNLHAQGCTCCPQKR